MIKIGLKVLGVTALVGAAYTMLRGMEERIQELEEMLEEEKEKNTIKGTVLMTFEDGTKEAKIEFKDGKVIDITDKLKLNEVKDSEKAKEKLFKELNENKGKIILQ